MGSTTPHPQFPGAVWQAPTKSGPWTDNCVEAASVGHQVLLRDSKDPEGAVLTFARDEFDEFVTACKAGEYDA